MTKFLLFLLKWFLVYQLWPIKKLASHSVWQLWGYAVGSCGLWLYVGAVWIWVLQQLVFGSKHWVTKKQCHRGPQVCWAGRLELPGAPGRCQTPDYRYLQPGGPDQQPVWRVKLLEGRETPQLLYKSWQINKRIWQYRNQWLSHHPIGWQCNNKQWKQWL